MLLSVLRAYCLADLLLGKLRSVYRDAEADLGQCGDEITGVANADADHLRYSFLYCASIVSRIYCYCHPRALRKRLEFAGASLPEARARVCRLTRHWDNGGGFGDAVSTARL